MPLQPTEMPATIPNRELRVLHIDDDEEDAMIFGKVLARLKGLKFQLSSAHNFEMGLKLAREGDFDLHFVDLRLGGASGLELMKQALRDQPNRAFVIITGAGDERQAADAIRQGACDYLPKASLNEEVLQQCITNCYTVPENRVIKLQLEYRPAIDKQTDVYSHDLFMRTARNRVAANLGTGGHWSVLMIEIDKFGTITDPKVASQTLRFVAQAVRATLSDTEPVGRCGANQFCVLMSCSGIEESMQLAEQIRAEVERSTNVTVSIGVSAQSAATADLDDLMSRASEVIGDGGNNQVCSAGTQG
jgi:diguanylate cyclase (GGDEF)-like protein